VIEGIAELASTETRLSSSCGLRCDVIDLKLDHANSTRQYQTPTLYINKNVRWEIPSETIPQDPQNTAEWENAGQSKIPWRITNFVDIANRAARLISDYITHRR